MEHDGDGLPLLGGQLLHRRPPARPPPPLLLAEALLLYVGGARGRGRGGGGLQHHAHPRLVTPARHVAAALKLANTIKLGSNLRENGFYASTGDLFENAK